MKQIETLLLSALLVGSVIPQTIFSHTIAIENKAGEQLEVEIDGNDRFVDVLDRIQSYLQDDRVSAENQQIQWNLAVSHAGRVLRAKTESKRIYLFEQDKNTSAFRDAKKSLAYIIDILANESILGIGKERKELQRRGDKLEWLHPLQFLEIIFTDEKNKAGFEKINTRKEHLSWLGINVKEGFYAGIIRGMQDEYENDNLLPWVDDFATTLGVNNKVKKALIEKIEEKGKDKDKKWKEFVYILMDALPRKGNDRYDM
jgi:hypothetical protein